MPVIKTLSYPQTMVPISYMQPSSPTVRLTSKAETAKAQLLGVPANPNKTDVLSRNVVGDEPMQSEGPLIGYDTMDYY